MRLWLRTFGCRANQYDTERVRALAEGAGCEIVDSLEEADAAVFNSCTVTTAAERELRRAVRQAASRRPGLRSVIMGCAAALSPPRGASGSLHDLPSVSAVVGGAPLEDIAGALGLSPAGSEPPAAQHGTRALLRIQDGCDEHCTFCATTLARGANRSRAADEVVAEAGRLAGSHVEIVLTGIHIGSWGSEHGSSLGALVSRLVREVPRVRFRLSSVEATEVDEALAALLRDAPERVAPHLHAPLQSGSDPLLRRMGRRWYTASSYAAAVERLVAGRDAFALGADVIAGFPGETEEDHAATLALIGHLPFTYLHVFPWSERPGTAAGRLGRRVPAEVAGRRAAELRALGAARAAAYRAARADGEADVVVIGSGGARTGLTGDYLTVALADPTLPRGGRFRARLEANGHRLVARPLHPVHS